MFLSACEKNDAKEAANESAQVEEEGVGEVTEEGEKVEAENKQTSDADDSSSGFKIAVWKRNENEQSSSDYHGSKIGRRKRIHKISVFV